MMLQKKTEKNAINIGLKFLITLDEYEQLEALDQ